MRVVVQVEDRMALCFSVFACMSAEGCGFDIRLRRRRSLALAMPLQCRGINSKRI
jgi:hypothetical protein